MDGMGHGGFARGQTEDSEKRAKQARGGQNSLRSNSCPPLS